MTFLPRWRQPIPWRRVARNEQVILSTLAVLIGVVVAFGSIGFRIAIGWVQSAFYGFSSDDVFTLAGALPWWQVLLAPAAGGLLIGLFIHYAMPGRRPLGVAHVITAGAHSGGRMSLRQGLSAAAVDAASLGVGGSAGREGPMVHLGATAAAFVAERFHLPPSLSITLLGCGVAAGVAA